ncbi:HVO_2523 family zinc finger protein [Natrarchaeobius sp. A-rgal3]|uniref:HVO_2523 family zinc finger protein n=1 Tax=Natrarchaeobius versutus TaxID=1679078 RepID=UPI00350F8565
MGSDSGDGSGSDSSRSPTNAPPSRAASGPTCPHCEAPMYKRHCKYVCPQHGVIIDCSDPFL